MLKLIILSLFTIFCLNGHSQTQKINGRILPSKSPVTILKIWGTHYERGFAYGYILGEKISSVFSLYSQKLSMKKYSKVRSLLLSKTCYVFDDEIITEAKAIIEGMNQAGTNPNNLDYIDLLIVNTLFDIGGIQSLPHLKSYACSVFMSWGNATKATDLDGESVISRHFDWWNPDEVLNNQIILIHIPSEPEEQPWVNVGIAGQIGVISGMNKSGVSVFLNAAPFTGLKGNIENKYEPVLFSLRKGIEKSDFNHDGENNIFDIQDVLSLNKSGYSKPCIVSAMTSIQNKTTDKTAMVAELTPTFPYITIRENEYPDNIPGDNLYVANSFLKLKNRKMHGTRNKTIVKSIGEGIAIDSKKNWELMRNYSRFKVPFNIESNIQFMQYIPSLNILKLAVSTDKTPAFLKAPVTFDLNIFYKTDIN